MDIKSIVILADSFYPCSTMSGNIANKISAELLNRGYDIRVITYKCNEEEKRYINNIEINYIYNWSFYWESILTKKIKKNPSKANELLYTIKRIVSNLTRNINPVGIYKNVVFKIYYKLEELYIQKPFNYVISISAPFEFQVANFYYSKANKNVKSILYQVDFWSTLHDRGLPVFMRKSRKKHRESFLYEMSSITSLVMTPVVATKEKIKGSYTAQLPLLVKYAYKTNINISSKIKIVYTGTLNKVERNPTKFIYLLEKIDKDNKIELHLYHRGDCGQIISKFQSRNLIQIFNYGTVDSNIAHDAIIQADILLIIGTPKGDQIAGKTFDYLSTGKKILYVAQNRNDINVDFLKDYPNLKTLYINEDWVDDELCTFIFSKNYNEIKYEEIEKKYEKATPHYFCSRFLENEDS